MQKYRLSELDEKQLQELCRRNAVDFNKIIPVVSEIIEHIRRNGDDALKHYIRKFDGMVGGPVVMNVPDPDEVDLPREIKKAFHTAYENIFAFHMAQMPKSLRVDTMPGITCSREAQPIERVGLYVPGGTAVLPSSVLMLGIPAKIAGCSEIIIATPPREDGTIAPEILYCAGLAGVDRILCAGGAQAIAALAWGTETVPKVDKIFGPGNQYVTCAKMLLQNSEAMIAIDMPAGPSEVLVIADETANPVFVAADLLSQAEHGEDSEVVLIALSENFIENVQSEIRRQMATLPRVRMIEKALSNSLLLLAESIDDAVTFSNRWAPEHLIVASDHASEIKPKITNAGSVFLGNYTPESVGDYASGTNHTLPTSGYARMYSGVSLDSFFKQITYQEITPEGLQNIARTIEIMAESEGLLAHKRAVSYRTETLNAQNKKE